MLVVTLRVSSKLPGKNTFHLLSGGKPVIHIGKELLRTMLSKSTYSSCVVGLRVDSTEASCPCTRLCYLDTYSIYATDFNCVIYMLSPERIYVTVYSDCCLSLRLQDDAFQLSRSVRWKSCVKNMFPRNWSLNLKLVEIKWNVNSILTLL